MWIQTTIIPKCRASGLGEWFLAGFWQSPTRIAWKLEGKTSPGDDQHLETEVAYVDRTAPDMADVGLPDLVGTVRLGQHPSYIGGCTRRGLSHSNPLADGRGRDPALATETDRSGQGRRRTRRPALRGAGHKVPGPATIHRSGRFGT